MKVQQLELAEQVGFAQHLHGLDDLGHGQSKFGSIAGGNAPATFAFGGQLGAHPQHRADTQAPTGGDDLADLFDLLKHNNAVLAQSPGQNGLLQVFSVLVAVAHEQSPGCVQHGHGDHQLGFGAGFQAKLMAFAKAHKVLDEVTLLVAFDRKYTAIGALVVVASDGFGECGVEPVDAILKDVGKAYQERQMETALAQRLDQFVKVQGAAPVSLRRNSEVTGGIDREIGIPPTGDAIEFFAVFDRPVGWIGFRRNRGGHWLCHERVSSRGVENPARGGDCLFRPELFGRELSAR